VPWLRPPGSLQRQPNDEARAAEPLVLARNQAAVDLLDDAARDRQA